MSDFQKLLDAIKGQNIRIDFNVKQIEDQAVGAAKTVPAAVVNAGYEVGNKVAPVVIETAQAVATKVEEAVAVTKETIVEVVEEVKPVVTEAVETTKEVAVEAAVAVQDTVSNAVEVVNEKIDELTKKD
ncbi:MAG: hypothetical protein QXN55_00555 [Candidatus Nitrosotenuis sp.]